MVRSGHQAGACSDSVGFGTLQQGLRLAALEVESEQVRAAHGPARERTRDRNNGAGGIRQRGHIEGVGRRLDAADRAVPGRLEVEPRHLAADDRQDGRAFGHLGRRRCRRTTHGASRTPSASAPATSTRGIVFMPRILTAAVSS